MNSSFDNISRIGKTFIRTLTHAQYSKYVFLIRLKAFEFFYFIFFCSTLMIVISELKVSLSQQ